jgi:hypothetical protein
MPGKLCAASRCLRLAVPEVVELKVEYGEFETYQDEE